jgi:hypothetical protein
MGCRITDHLRAQTEYDLRCIECGERGIANLAARGIRPRPVAEATRDADVVVFAVPDRTLGELAREVVPRMKPASLVVLLDPAAAHAGELPERPDISYFLTHPCHPGVFQHQPDAETRADFFGGTRAGMPIVCALMQGPEADYERGERLARAFCAPVTRAHRLTVEQMALLEPAMAETVGACCATVLREAMDEAIDRGVPAEAARDFMLGHINIALAIAFGETRSTFSDGAKLIIDYGRRRLLRPDWKCVFEPAQVADQVRAIVRGQAPNPRD